jgi:hypothetical protein
VPAGDREPLDTPWSLRLVVRTELGAPGGRNVPSEPGNGFGTGNPTALDPPRPPNVIEADPVPPLDSRIGVPLPGVVVEFVPVD